MTSLMGALRVPTGQGHHRLQCFASDYTVLARPFVELELVGRYWGNR